jgi:lysozyme
MKRINRAGVDLIRTFEGLRLKAYKCPAGVWTIGYGSTGPHVTEGKVITRDEAEGLLVNDLRRFEQAVEQYCPVTTDNQFAALVSFAFNLGPESLRTSTLRRKHNEGDYVGAAAQFARWTRAGGRVLPGLVKRRAAESALYQKD